MVEVWWKLMDWCSNIGSALLKGKICSDNVPSEHKASKRQKFFDGFS